MKSILGDFGTSFVKFYSFDDDSFQTLKTKDFILHYKDKFKVLAATGHIAKAFCKNVYNEIVCLYLGAKRLIAHEDFFCVDVGSRDIKFILVKNGKLVDLNLNDSCATSLGFTIQVIGKFYDIDFSVLPFEQNFVQQLNPIAVRCGLLALEKVFDYVNNYAKPDVAVLRFIKGLAFNIYQFTKQPKVIYLSGGLTQNTWFVRSLECFCEVRNIGRYVLIEGLKFFFEKNKI